MLDTGFDAGTFQAIWNNESTMYVELDDLFAEHARLAGARRPVRHHHRLLQRRVRACRRGRSARSTPTTSATSTRAAPTSGDGGEQAGPTTVVDLTAATIPYWELRQKSSVATGIEEAFLTAYKEGSFQYLMIAADKV